MFLASYLQRTTVVINKNFNDIVETICNMMRTHTTTAIYINYNDFSNIEALNSRLFLKYANFIQMPGTYTYLY